MQRFTTFVVCLFTAAALSAGNPDMSEEQMQEMMKNAGEMQKCMAKVDQSALEKLSQQGEQMETKVKKLCAAGKRDQAQEAAMIYGREIAASKAMQSIKQCGEMAQQMLQQMPLGKKGTENRHICDSF